MTKALKLAAIAAAALIVAPALAQTAAISLPGGDTPFTNGSWVFGQRFQVGAQSLSLTALGAYDDAGNGFVTDGGIQVGLYRESDQALLASATIQSSDTLDGYYRFADVSAVTLEAGEIYRVVAVNRDDNYNVTPGSFAPGLIDLGDDYCSGTTLQYCGGISDGLEWMANFKFDAASGAVPEPASWAMMLGGFGLVGGAMRSRRKAVVSFG